MGNNALSSKSSYFLSKKDEENLDENTIILLESLPLKLIIDSNPQKVLYMPFPSEIKLQKLMEILLKELDFPLESHTKIQIKERNFQWKELREKTLSDLQITDEISIFFKENITNFAFDDKNGNFQKDFNNETDISSGNGEIIAESVKTMSTSISLEIPP